jgi:hypothetical protein
VYSLYQICLLGAEIGLVSIFATVTRLVWRRGKKVND